MQLRIPVMMIIMAFGAGCSDLPPRERDDRRGNAAADAAEHRDRQLISPVQSREDGDGGEEGARYD